jgi:long-chain acyl-CoA synthetase
VVLCANESIHQKLSNLKNSKVSHIVNFESDEFKFDIDELKNGKKIQTIKSIAIKPNHDAVIIYTSGTTGLPKGVVLSHDNIVSNLKGLYQVRGNDNVKGQVALSFLPWAHIFGQTAELNALISTGSAVAIVPRREEILECIGLVKPTMILSVPLFINKIYDAIHKKIALRPTFVQNIFKEALRVARAVNTAKEMNQDPGFINPILYNFYDKLVFEKIRAGLGGNIRFMGSGGAALSLPVLQFFEDINIPIVEGYGLTETSPIVSTSTVVGPGPGKKGLGKSLWSTKRLGCLGVPLPNISVRIIDPETLKERSPGEIGEIIVSGPSIMTRYYKNPEATNSVFITTPEGKRYFRTGDLGLLVDNKFVKLAGRIKEQYKLENGKFVGPTPLEDMIITTSELTISQCFLFGENRKFNVLLVVPEPTEFKKWCESNGINISIAIADVASINENETVVQLYTNMINKSCESMKAYEKPRKFYLLNPLTDSFTQENQLLTPKMSLRRSNIVKAHLTLLNEIYDDKKGHNL